jgi:hypothetical protein
MRWSMLGRAVAVLWVGLTAVAAMPAWAQVPYPAPAGMPVPEASDIAHCLCLQQAVDALDADMNARQQAYQAARDDLARIDAQLQSARAGVDVNNPQSVAQFRQLLERRDAAFHRSTSMATGDLSSITERYNARVNEHNARCANRPRDPVLLQNVQATLSCPPVY